MQSHQTGIVSVGASDAAALALFAYFGLFFLLAFFWPTWRLWSRHKTKALVLSYDDSAHGLVGRWFRATLVAIPIILGALVAGVAVEALGRIAWIEGEVVRVVGWSILAASLIWILAAQAQMGRSWRIGIDAGGQPPLVKTGLFALSRNPIFLGMRFALLGLFLVLPTGATLAVLVLGEALMQIQVRLEEAHLSQTLGEEYEAYRGDTRRWL